MKSIVVFCGSSAGTDPAFTAAARAALSAGGHDGLTELEIVGTLTERKVRMGGARETGAGHLIHPIRISTSPRPPPPSGGQ
jgi:hypothetical protein